MKKVITLCLAAMLGAGLAVASPGVTQRALPADASHRQLVRACGWNRYLAPSPSRRTASLPGLRSPMQTAFLQSVLSPKKAPMRIGASGSSVYGAIAVAPTLAEPKNVAEVFLDGNITTLPVTFPAGPHGGPMKITGMYVRNGNYVCFVDEIFTGQYIYGSWLFEIAPDGTVVDSKEYSATDYRFTLMAYNPSQDKIYGYVVIEEKLYFATASGRNPLDVTLGAEVTPVDRPVCAMTCNQVTGRLVGLAGKTVVSIDPADGSQKAIGSIDTPSEYITGMAYSPYDEGYFYAVSTDAANGIQLLDENNFSTLTYTEYDGIVGFYNLYCTDMQAVSDDAPGEARLINTIFADGATDGAITYRIPSATYGGTPILGDINWELEVDGVPSRRGSAAAGSDVVVSLTGLEEGMHTFTFKTSTGGKYGPYLTTSFYVGNDTPCAPAWVKINEQTISWEAVTAGVNKGYVDPAQVTYNVYLNGKRIAGEISATECPSQLPVGETVESYVASVEAIFHGKKSDLASSDDIVFGQPCSIPESFEPTEHDSRLFTVLDANGDGNTLSLIQMRFGSAGVKTVYMYNTDKRVSADDWLFLPVTAYDNPEAVYEFSMNAMRGENKVEQLEVMLCTAPSGNPEDVVTTILPLTSLTNDPSSSVASLDYYLRGTYTVPTAGAYYVGIHVKSARNRGRVILRDFSVTKVEGVSISHPRAATSLKAVTAPGGVLQGTVTLTLPTATVAGIPYEEGKELSATVKAYHCDAVKVYGHAGETVSVTVPTRQGDNIINVTTYDGELRGLTSSVTLYSGVEAPAAVTELTGIVDASDYTATLRWTAPATGVYGGYIDPAEVHYYLMRYLPDGDSYKWTEIEDLGTDVTTCTFSLPEGTPQQLVQLAVRTENFAGQCNRLSVFPAVMGRPDAIPVSFNFRAADSFPNPTVNYSSEDVELYLGDPADDYSEYATDDNARALYSMSYYDVEDAFFTLPKFSTTGSVNAAISLDVYGGSTSSFSIVASAPGVDRKVVKTFTASDFTTAGPQTVTVDLPAEFQNKEWVEAGICYNTTYSWYGSSEVFILYAYSFFDNVPYDFGVTAIEGPALASIGSENVYKAHVLNFGNSANPMPASSWTLTDEEGNVVTQAQVAAGTAPVAPGDELTFDITFTPTADQVGLYTLNYNIDRADNKEHNDSRTARIEVGRGAIPVITDLHATSIGCDAVELAWSPVSGYHNVLEDFEESTPLVLDSESDRVADFTRVDGDGASVYGPNSEDYQNQPYGNKPQSFVVWSHTDMEEILHFGEKTPYTAASGDKFLVAFCPGPDSNGNIPAADDWLISPELVGGSLFSFYMKSITYQYGAETVEILYSTSGTECEDFTLLQTVKTPVGEGSTTYEYYEFTLPEDARYVAIRYVSRDIFGIIIDDIGYAPADAAVSVSGYDFYRDGMKIADCAPCPGNTFTDDTVSADTSYTYTMVPVLSDGSKGALSNTLLIHTTGVEGILAGEETPGQLLRTDGVPVTGTPGPGVYLLRKGDKVSKVIISK